MRKKWIWIACASVAVVMISVALGVLIYHISHKHKLGDAKVYHIYNDHITYTRQCVKDKHTQSFTTDKTFAEIIANLSGNDKIVVEEDISKAEVFRITPTLSQTESAGNDIEINIDLNNKKIRSMFELNATYGNIKFNISNGIIDSTSANAIKISGQTDKVEVNISNVECYSTGYKNAALYVEYVNAVEVNASNSKFISKNDGSIYDMYGVGVFINNKGNFRFENCILEGGDGIHVRQGTVSLKGCDLINSGLIARDYQSVSSGFNAVGASLAAHCYTSAAGTTKFEITVENCAMVTNNSNRVIYVYKTAQAGYGENENINSYIDIVSCKFDENPEAFGNPDIIEYVNGGNPVNDGQGYWVYGNVNK